MEVKYPTIIAVVGGEGTRLYPITLNLSKPTVDMCNKAILARMLEPLVREGCREVILAAKGYENTAQLNKYFKDGQGFFAELGIKDAPEMKYQPNYEDCGSGDAVRYCMEYYGLNNDCLVIGGDNIIDVEIRQLIEMHHRNGAVLTVLLKEIKPGVNISPFGVAELGDNFRVKRFVEKPKKGTEPSRFINSGVYLFSPKIRKTFKEMGDNVKDLGRDVVPYLIENGYPVYGHILTGYWADVGTPGSFLKTTLDVLHGKIKGITLKHKCCKDKWIHPTTLERNNGLGNVNIRDHVLIGRHCTIGKDVEIQNSCIGHFCVIEDGAKVRDSVVLSFVNVGRDVILNKCILGRFTTVMENGIIDADINIDFDGEVDDPFERVSVVGGGGVTIRKNSVIGPKKRVAPIDKSHKILSTGKFTELGMDNENVYFIENR